MGACENRISMIAPKLMCPIEILILAAYLILTRTHTRLSLLLIFEARFLLAILSGNPDNIPKESDELVSYSISDIVPMIPSSDDCNMPLYSP